MSRTQKFLIFLYAFLISASVHATEVSSLCAEIENLNKQYEEIKSIVGPNVHIEIPLDELDICNLLDKVISHQSTSDLLQECYAKIQSGYKSLPLHEILAIIPELISFVQDMHENNDNDRAPRPGSQSADSNDAIVGKDGCDLTQVLALLGVIKKRIQILQEIICDKFEQTWTILEEIREEIIDTRTILCDKFEQTWTILAEIDQDIFDTRTILCDKFQQTWTMIEGMITTMTKEFSSVFTALDAICDKIEGTFTSLEAIEQEVVDTRTILCDKFEQTWTILAEIDQDIFDTRTILCAKFEGTFTVLEAIEQEIIGTRTILCNKFEQTWTILAEIDQDIFDTRTILCAKFEGTFTELEAISEEIGTLSETFSAELANTLTIICDKFEQTWTILAEIDQDIFDTRTILCDKFNQTWTMIDGMITTMTVDFTGVFTVLNIIDQDVIDTRTILCDKFEQTWTILGCNTTAPISMPIEITQSGKYCLTNDIVGTITINADRVLLDLNGFQIAGSSNAITIAAGHTDISIQGGMLVNADAGIEMTDATNVDVLDIDFVANITGINIITSTWVNVENCSFREHTHRIIYATNSDTIKLTKINAHNNTETTGLDFFIIDLNSTNNIFIDYFVATNNVNALSLLSAIKTSLVNDIAIHNSYITSNTGSPASLVNFDSTNKITLQDVLINDNEGLEALEGIIFNACQDANLTHCSVNKNTSMAFIGGFNIISTERVQFNYCTANNNTSADLGQSVGFDSSSGIDILYDHCISNSNFSATSDSIGFRDQNGIKAIYESCIANDNVGTLTGIGFHLINTSTSCIQDSIAKRNQGLDAVGGTGRGFFLLDTVNCWMRNNFAAANFGPSTGIGIEVSNTGGAGSLITTVFSNQSQDHASNYIITPGDILRITYNRSAVPPVLSAVPTPLDNIDIF